MVSLFADGKKVGTLADAERLLPGLLSCGARVELRDEAGARAWAVQPVAAELPAPWDPSITWEELERRRAEPGLTWEEAKKWMGWE